MNEEPCEPGSSPGVDAAPGRRADKLGTFQKIVEGLSSPRGFAMHGGTAYVAAYDGLVEVSPTGDTQMMVGQSWIRVAADRDLLAWTTVDQIVTAPFSNLASETVVPMKAPYLLTVDDGYVYVLRENAILRVRPGSAPEPVVSGADGSEIAIDGDDLYFFASPNNTSLELRRASKSGGESERIATGVTTGPNGLGRDLAVTATTVFFTDGAGTLYTVPRAGGARPRSIATGVSDVLPTKDGVYYVSVEDDIGRLYTVDASGKNPKFLAQLIADHSIELAADETGLYALQLHGTGVLYRYVAN